MKVLEQLFLLRKSHPSNHNRYVNRVSNVILTGLPRSGTTLTCHLLNKVPNTVALDEPMKVGRFSKLKKDEAIYDYINCFCNNSRRSIMRHKKVRTKHVNGVVPDNTRGMQLSRSGLRSSISSMGDIPIKKELTSDFVLVIKHPAAFTALLKILNQRFACYAVIRNPLSILASWSTVDMAVANGHAHIAELLDTQLASLLDSIDDKRERQIQLLSWFFAKFQEVLPKRSILRYEDIIQSGGKALNVIVPQASELSEDLQSKNLNRLYNKQLMRKLGKKLLHTEGAFWKFYSKDSVEQLMKAIE